MTTRLAPRAVIPSPPAAPPPISLVASAVRPGETADGGTSILRDDTGARIRWEGGFAYLPENCAAAGRISTCDNATSKTIGDNLDTVDFVPYGVWAGFKCSTFGFEATDYQGRARRLLLAAESQQIEAELWSGDIAQENPDWPNRWFTDGSAVTVTDGPTSPSDALACLEQALAECGFGPRSMIHATPQIVTRWWDAVPGALRRDANRIYTQTRDTIVVPGVGYDGSGPDGTPAAEGSVWAYATTVVTVLRGEIGVVPESYDAAVTEARNRSFAQAIDPSDNTLEVRAERIAAATWDGCCLFAAEIDASLCTAGS